MVKILLDIDCVTVDFVGHLRWWVNDIPADDEITEYGFISKLDPRVLERVQTALKLSAFWRTVPLMPGAEDGVAYLASKYDVTPVSSPWRGCPTWDYDRRELLNSRWRGLELGEKLITTKHKDSIVGSLMVDDKLEHIEKWGARMLAGRSEMVVFDQPWNRDTKIPITRVHNWDELTAHIDRYAKRKQNT